MIKVKKNFVGMKKINLNLKLNYIYLKMMLFFLKFKKLMEVVFIIYILKVLMKNISFGFKKPMKLKIKKMLEKFKI